MSASFRGVVGDGAVAGRLASDPFHKPRDLRFRFQQRDRVQLALELFLGIQGMDMFVARAAEHRDSMSDVGSIEVPFVSLVLVTSARDQVMAGEGVDCSSAQLTLVLRGHVEKQKCPRSIQPGAWE